MFWIRACEGTGIRPPLDLTKCNELEWHVKGVCSDDEASSPRTGPPRDIQPRRYRVGVRFWRRAESFAETASRLARHKSTPPTRNMTEVKSEENRSTGEGRYGDNKRVISFTQGFAACTPVKWSWRYYVGLVQVETIDEKRMSLGCSLVIRLYCNSVCKDRWGGD